MYVISKLAVATALLCFSFQVHAQEVAPGAPCTVGENGRFRLSGGAELSGVGHLISCNGANWIKVFTFDTTGVIQPQFTNGASCGDGDPLVYDAATGGMTCSAGVCSDNTPEAFNFTDVINSSASTLATSDIVQISGINCKVNVTISGEGSPQYRTCSNGSSLANCDGSVIQDWTDVPSGIDNNQYVQMRLTSSAIGGDTFTANLVVGNTIDAWNVSTTGDCTGSPVPGTVCADGTIYAGVSPDDFVAMYTTRCDEGMSWSGAVCTDTRVQLPWNNGNVDGDTDASPSSNVTGEANTSTLYGIDADGDTAGHQFHQAAKRCTDLNQNGHTDWYLPARDELEVLYDNNSVIKNFVTSGYSYYWSSTEHSVGVGSGRARRFSDGNETSNSKNTENFIRCVRR